MTPEKSDLACHGSQTYLTWTSSPLTIYCFTQLTAAGRKFQRPSSSLIPLWCKRGKPSQQLCRGLLEYHQQSQVPQSCNMRSGFEVRGRESAGEQLTTRTYFTASLDRGTTESGDFHLQSVHSSLWAVNQLLHIYSHKRFHLMVSPTCLQSLPMDNFSALKDGDNLNIKPMHSVQQFCSHRLSEEVNP